MEIFIYLFKMKIDLIGWLKWEVEIVYGGIWCDGGKPSWETWMTAAPLQCVTFSLLSIDKAGNESSEKTGQTNRAASKEWERVGDREKQTEIDGGKQSLEALN